MAPDPPDNPRAAPSSRFSVTSDWIDAFTEQIFRSSLRGLAASILAAVLPAVIAYLIASIVAPDNTGTQLDAFALAFFLCGTPLGLACHVVAAAARASVQHRAARRIFGAPICLHCGLDKSGALAKPCSRCGRTEAAFQGIAGPETCDYLGSIPEIASLNDNVHVVRVFNKARMEMGPIASQRIMLIILLLIVAPVLILAPYLLASSNRLAATLGFDPMPIAALIGFSLAAAMPLLYRQWLVRQLRHDVRRELERQANA